MKLENITPGMQVTINCLPNATVYTVHKVEGFTAMLSHPKMAQLYEVDYLLLRAPTAIQLASAGMQ